MIYPIRLGITLGIIWGFTMLIFSLITNNYGISMFNALAEVYLGCSKKNLFSKLLCGLWGFADAFILGILIGYIYNYIRIDM